MDEGGKSSVGVFAPKRKNLRQVLLNWDIAAIVLLLVAVVSMFEVVIKRLMVDARLDDYQDVVEVVDERFTTALGFVERRELLPYRESLTLISNYSRSLALSLLPHQRSFSLVLLRDGQPTAFAALRTDPDQNLEADRFRAEGELGAAALRRLADSLPESRQPGEPARRFSFELDGEPYIGVVGLLSAQPRRGGVREQEPGPAPLLLVADRQRDFFLAVNRTRNLFLAVMGGILGVILAVKLLSTITATREIREIQARLLEEGRVIRSSGQVGLSLTSPVLSFRETKDLFSSYSDLNRVLAEVGEIIGGLSDPDLFVAVLRNDRSLLEPHDTSMSVLFIDVVGFTAIAESQGTRSMRIINRIWDCVEQAVSRHGGKVNKYIGDAALILFSGSGSKDALAAVQTAAELLQDVDSLSHELGVELNFRVGLDHGELVYGRTGSARKYELGVIGDPVNTASRLEALNRRYGTQILLSGAILQAARLTDTSTDLQGELKLLHLDRVRPKGKKIPIDLFTLVKFDAEGRHFLGAKTVLEAETLEAYEKLEKACRAGLAYWKKGEQQRGEQLWSRLAQGFARLWLGSHFAPGGVLLQRLVKASEIRLLKAEPITWLKRRSVEVQPPREDWLLHGAPELAK